MSDIPTEGPLRAHHRAGRRQSITSDPNEDGRCTVCSTCAGGGDAGIADLIESAEARGECGYCLREGNVLPSELVLEHIMSCINREYEDAAESVGYDSQEGGYGLPTMDPYELLEDIGLEPGSDEFLKEIAKELFYEDKAWVKQDPYAEHESIQLVYDWDVFSKQVKHRTRFTFFKIQTDPDEKYCHPLGLSEPHEVMARVVDIIFNLNHVKTLLPTDKLYRARQAKCTTEEEIHAPRSGQVLRNNRMNPAGISMFYSATDIGTALAEARCVAVPDFTVGEFQPTRELTLLDFSVDVPDISIFYEEPWYSHQEALFLNSFIRIIAEPIDERVNPIEYVPTQVLTEYIRYLVKVGDRAVDGLLYRSSLSRSGSNVVLFTGSPAELREGESSMVRLNRLVPHDESARVMEAI